MRVAVIISRCSNLGPFIVAKDIVNNLYNKIEAIDVFYIRESNEKIEFITGCTKISFFQRLDFSNYDVVHSHGFVADAYVYFNRRQTTCKYITTIHQRIAPDYAMKYNSIVGYLFEKIWCSFIRDSTTIVALTKEMAGYYEKRLKRQDIQFIYNGISECKSENVIPYEEFEKIMELKKRYKVIGVSARLIPLKGIDQVIKAIAHTNEFSLLVIGDGELKVELEALAKEVGVGDRCLFLGYKKRALDYFRFFDLYAMSSRSEGFGLCVIEAASQKVPIVCSDLPVYREIFDEEDVVRFELENIPSLVEALSGAIMQHAKLSGRVYVRYRNNFTATIMADKYLKVYSN